MKIILLLLTLLVGISNTSLSAQEVVDSCFLSVKTVGRYVGSDDLHNTCYRCGFEYYASDLLEWDPDNKIWKGALPNNMTLDLPPPPGDCLQRAIWLGSPSWTGEGEGFALRLDKPLEPGKKYSFSFTYAADGADSDNGFGPVFLTYSLPGVAPEYAIDTLPRSYGEWITNSVKFTASQQQRTHDWIVLFAWDDSGTVLSNCKNKNPLKANLFPPDSALCSGDSILLKVQEGPNIQYHWNTDSISSFYNIVDPGEYSVEAKYFNCSTKDSITVYPRDCETRMVMPNVFTPNGDSKNALFMPIESNFISSGNTIIYNRWGEKLFEGNLFQGWNGNVNGEEAPTGVYYYKILYSDERENTFEKKGIVSLLR